MRQILISSCKQLVTVNASGTPVKKGPAMRDIGLLENASVLIEDGIIAAIGDVETLEKSLGREATIIDASASVALPGFVDAHTHLLFAGSREDEFAMRAEGRSYQEIARAGGGILSTVQATRAAGKRALKKSAERRLDALMRHGTTTVEIKSGYGLDPDNEIKMLEALRELSTEHLATIVTTFLGAHAIPPEFKERPEDYVTLICERMLPYVAGRNLASFCDVFCEKGYFTVEQSRVILEQARKLGMNLKLHADELAPSGGSMLAAELKAVSADHLEHIDGHGIESLSNAGVVAVLLPGVSFFLNHGYAPARTLIDAGVPVALATDFNPGSCMSFSMPLMMTIACTHMNMTPEEAITASTLNGAAAVGLSDKVGSIEVGKQADIILYDVPSYRFLSYHFGVNHVQTIIKNGTLLEFS